MRANLSIIVVNFNKTPQQIEECFQSIKEQTVTPGEIIFVDDASQDPHAHAMATSIILPRNVGVSKARDVGVRMSSCKLLLFVDADDKLSPDFVEQCGFVISKCDIAYPNTIIYGQVEANKLSISPATFGPKNLLDKECHIPVTSMMHRKVYETLGGFRQLPVFEDWDFWVRAMAAGFTFKRANTLLWYRQSIGSRNHVSFDLRTDVYNQITDPYYIKGGKICLKQEG